MSAAKHTPGWCWMTHPDWNEGRPIPVLLQTADGEDYYVPLDPLEATEYEWDKLSPEWQMVRDSLSEARAAVINEELQGALEKAATAMGAISTLLLTHAEGVARVHALAAREINAEAHMLRWHAEQARAAIAKATGSVS